MAINPGAQLICVANIKLSAAHAVAQSEAFHKLGPSVSALTCDPREGTRQTAGERRAACSGERRAACSRARVRLPSGSRAERWKVHEALESARAEDGADFEACASATAGDRLCALLLALERRHWQLHQPAPDAHSWLACSCRRARAPNAANCISRGCRLARRALESARSAGKCTSRGRRGFRGVRFCHRGRPPVRAAPRA